MARNRNLFDDTTMTFGEHLEVLRVHLWKSLIGVMIGVVVSMFFGDRIIGILKAPVEKALQDANMENVQDDLKDESLFDFFAYWFSSDDSKESSGAEPEVLKPEISADSLRIRISSDDLRNALRDVVPALIPEEPASAAAEGPVRALGQEQGRSLPTEVELTIHSEEIAVLNHAAERFNKPVTYKVEEGFLAFLKVTLVSGLMLASPWVFYQIWQFIAAGLYPHERRYVHVYLPMSIGLFISGALFCFYFVFPIVLKFLIGFSHWMGVEIQPRLSEYISLVLMLPLLFGISFQLPMVMLFLERIGIVTVQTYSSNWRMAILIISVVSMLLTPSDPGSMLLMLLPLIVLYYCGIQLCHLRLGASKDPLT